MGKSCHRLDLDRDTGALSLTSQSHVMTVTLFHLNLPLEHGALAVPGAVE